MNERNLREALLGIGIGDYNATIIIPYMMIAPAATDPKAAQVYLMVQAIQRALFALGATDVAESGRLDDATAAALRQVVGVDWEAEPWLVIIEALNNAAARDARITPSYSTQEGFTRIAVGGPLDFLPEVPGGIVTYAVGAALLWHFYSKRKRRAS